MGSRFNSAQSTTIVNASILTTVESVVVSITGITTYVDGALVYLAWFVNATAGGGMATCKVNLRRGTSTSGTLLNVNQALTFVATETDVFSGSYFDNPGAASNLSYVVSFLSTGGTTTINDVSLYAFVL